jgi:hypothetical protein
VKDHYDFSKGVRGKYVGRIMKSNCCSASVRVGGEGVTHYYMCIQCGKACDLQPDQTKAKP